MVCLRKVKVMEVIGWLLLCKFEVSFFFMFNVNVFDYVVIINLFVVGFYCYYFIEIW